MKRADKLPDWLYEALTVSIPEGSTIPTLANGRPNRVTAIAREGVWVVTEKSEREGSGARLVPAWMIQAAWDHLEQHGELTNRYLLSDAGLNVKRSSAVCAVLARLPQVRVASSRPIRLELVR